MPRRFAIALLLLSGGMAPALAAAATAAENTPARWLPELEARAEKLEAQPESAAQFDADVLRLIESNTLKSGRELSRAAQLAMLGRDDAFRKIRVSYELMLAAAGRDEMPPDAMLARAWDGLLLSVGRPLRMDFSGIFASDPELREMFGRDPAPAVIQAAWREPAKLRAKAAEAKNNPEMQAIVDADQASRKKDWSKFTEAEHKAQRDGDRQRNARTREIVAAGALQTAADFANASLVMQHSPTFAGYQLAHELAVASLLLGDRGTGRWLVAATYDRMLNSIAHDQRFGTQYMDDALVDVDERGICDEERLALGCRGISAPQGDALVRKAERLVAEKKFAEAEPAAREAVQRRTAGYGAGAWQVHSAQRILGASLLGQKKYTEAEPVLLEAYRGLKANEGTIAANYRVRLRDTAALLAELYGALQQPEKAAEWQQRVAEYDRGQPAAAKK